MVYNQLLLSTPTCCISLWESVSNGLLACPQISRKNALGAELGLASRASVSPRLTSDLYLSMSQGYIAPVWPVLLSSAIIPSRRFHSSCPNTPLSLSAAAMNLILSFSLFGWSSPVFHPYARPCSPGTLCHQLSERYTLTIALSARLGST